MPITTENSNQSYDRRWAGAMWQAQYRAGCPPHRTGHSLTIARNGVQSSTDKARVSISETSVRCRPEPGGNKQNLVLTIICTRISCFYIVSKVFVTNDFLLLAHWAVEKVLTDAVQTRLNGYRGGGWVAGVESKHRVFWGEGWGRSLLVGWRGSFLLKKNLKTSFYCFPSHRSLVAEIFCSRGRVPEDGRWGKNKYKYKYEKRLLQKHNLILFSLIRNQKSAEIFLIACSTVEFSLLTWLFYLSC